jgi:histidine kinase
MLRSCFARQNLRFGVVLCKSLTALAGANVNKFETQAPLIHTMRCFFHTAIAFASIAAVSQRARLMLGLPGYQIHSEVHAGQASLVYRGVRLSDAQPIIMKLLRNAYPTAAELERYQREFRISKQHQLQRTVPILALERFDHRLALIYPDDGSISLKRHFAGRPLDTAQLLHVGIGIAAALAELHALNWVHCDVNPANVLIQRETGAIKLTDLELCGPPTREDRALGTLAYMAPEQTGRTRFGVDQRSDLYALGATLFELATARSVFPEMDEASLLHAHLALAPPMPQSINPAVPDLIAQILLKLLSKAPSDRYQSVRGLLLDLEEAKRRLEAGGISDFALGSGDHVSGLRATEALFGRDAALATLLTAHRDASAGARVWVHIEGPAGAGKSALFEHFKRSVASAQQPASGRSDRLSTSIPYASISSAFQSVVNSWLALPEESLERIKGALKQALGINAAVIANMVPDLKKLLGALPPLLPLGAAAEQARFQLATHAFVRLAIAHATPLVLHLDDLHWADPASLDFLKRLLASDLNTLLLITVARDDENSTASEWLLQLRNAGIDCRLIQLADLQPADVLALLRANLGELQGGTASESELAAVIMRKTHGNPFYVRQFLLSLVETQVLLPQGKLWCLDSERLREQNLSDNVLEFLNRKLNQLPSAEQLMLLRCACIGLRFDLATLQRLLAELAHDSEPLLDKLCSDGLLLRLSETELCFVHERIREAVLSSAREQDRLQIHRRIGEIWRTDWFAQPESRALFDVVNQLNLASTQLQHDAERSDLAALNVQAAQLARSQAAYESSLGYAGHAVSLLPFSIYQDAPQQALATHVLLAEAQASAGQLKDAVQVFQHALALAQDADAQAHVLDRLASALQSSGDAAGALREVRKALALLGENVDLESPELAQETTALIARLSQDDMVQRLQTLAVASGRPAQIGALYDKAVIGVYFSRPELLGYITARSVLHVLNTGLTPEAGVSIGWWAMVLCMHDKHLLASSYGRLAADAHAKFHDDYFGGAALMLAHAMSLAWTVPYAENYAGAERSYQLCHQSGNLQFASYGLIVQHISAVAEAADCIKMLDVCERWRDYCARYVPLELGQAQIRCYVLRQLMGQQPATLDCEAILSAYEQQSNHTDVCESLTEMARAELLWGNYEKALALEQRAAPMFAAGAAGSLLLNFLHHVNLACASARVAMMREAHAQQKLRQQYADSLEKITRWSALNEQNFASYLSWVRAEGFIGEGRIEQASSELLLGIAHAQKNAYHLLQGKLTTLLSECFRMQGRSFWSALEQDAQQLYARANALGLAQHRDQRSTSATLAERRFHSGTPSSGTAHVDLVTVLKANEAIASELDFDQLVLRLLRIAVENAGAQRGVLALQRDGRLMLEADSQDGRINERVGRSARCPDTLLNYVARTQMLVVWDDGAQGSAFRDDPYFQKNATRAALCLPMLRQGELTGVMYLENNLVPGVFSRNRLEMLNMLLGAASIAIENAALYQQQRRYAEELEQRVRERTLALENANQELARLAEIDGLTQVSNRRSFDAYAKKLLMQGKRLCLALGDVDDFKRYNDRYGHAAGDEVLRQVGESLRALNLPAGALVARYGGEEFAILIPDCDAELAIAHAQTWLDRVLLLGIEHADARAKNVVSMSIGVAAATAASDTVTMEQCDARLLDLIERADRALYRAKADGRARVA